MAGLSLWGAGGGGAENLDTGEWLLAISSNTLFSSSSEEERNGLHFKLEYPVTTFNRVCVYVCNARDSLTHVFPTVLEVRVVTDSFRQLL